MALRLYRTVASIVAEADPTRTTTLKASTARSHKERRRWAKLRRPGDADDTNGIVVVIYRLVVFHRRCKFK